MKTKLSQLRKNKGWTQLDLAEKLNVSRQAVSRWESGLAIPSTENLKFMGELYEVPVDYLLNDEIESPRETGETKKEPQSWYSKRKRWICGIVVTCIAVVVMVLLGKIFFIKDSEEATFSMMERETWNDTGSKDFTLDW